MSIGILAMLVCMLMFMSNTLATLGPPVWINQATLSNIDSNPSKDPENSGFGPIQAVVWEEEVAPGNHDIWMKWSGADGALGSWVFSINHPAITNDNEINPAVTVTNQNPDTLATEIHVVYQLDNGGNMDVCHVWTNDWGQTWTGPITLDRRQAEDARDPAIVYTEDVSNPGQGLGMLVQFVWSEVTPALGAYDIYYEAFYYDPTVAAPGRFYVFLSGCHPMTLCIRKLRQ